MASISEAAMIKTSLGMGSARGPPAGNRAVPPPAPQPAGPVRPRALKTEAEDGADAGDKGLFNRLIPTWWPCCFRGFPGATVTAGRDHRPIRTETLTPISLSGPPAGTPGPGSSSPNSAPISAQMD